MGSSNVTNRYGTISAYINQMTQDGKLPDGMTHSEIAYIISISTPADREKYAKILTDYKAKNAKNINKYNISRSGPNEALEDVRNYHNFRSFINEYPERSKSVAGKADLWNAESFRTGTSPSKSYYMSNGDFLYTDKIKITSNSDITPILDESCVQPIILNEFQPDTILYDLTLYSKAISTGLNIVEKIPGVDKIMKILKGVGEFTQDSRYRRCCRSKFL